MAYADDALVFLHNESDFLRLQQHLSTYSSASNALLNMSKTEVFPLSGIRNDRWSQFLINFNIRKWYDRSSSIPLRYLGFPMCFSTNQRNTFFTNLLDKIKSACLIHAERNLSIRGRVTVLNSLILSRLWHALRIFHLNKSQLNKLCSTASRFINNYSSISISFQTACLPRSEGGLGVINPKLQILKLQWRWLVPLLLTFPTSHIDPVDASPPNRISVPYSKFILHHASSLTRHHPLHTSYLWPLLFPACRPSYLTQSPFHPFATIFDIIDSLLCRAYDNVKINLYTSLLLPLPEIIHPSRILTNRPPTLQHSYPQRNISKALSSRPSWDPIFLHMIQRVSNSD